MSSKHTSAASLDPTDLRCQPRLPVAAARRQRAWMHKRQPPLPPPEKHQPVNTHCPGSIALAVLGARVIR